ncbi:MAG: hypothetical protein CME63_00845 [Halobacteriovoraceae bacterium]|nr:hypothetical protein [Halobacteriovoraceae bacterium]MBC96273.1 hypothetical protein [Halobacteriovoraceae bacterium]|tara:strand:- start:44022 stop:45746 length:1725 start_codon:yes stop_codon:yes gene_type:complete
MEDQNRTSIEKNEGQLIKLIYEDISDPSVIGFDFNHDTNQKNLKISFNQGEYDANSNQSASILSWIRDLSKGHKNFAQTNLDYLDDSRKQYSSFRKKLQNQLKIIRKEQEISGKNRDKINNYFIESEYRELYNIIHNLQSLPSFLLTLDAFKSYSTCQIIAHEKGNAFSSSNFCTVSGKSHAKRIPVESFNKGFQSIKKSKSHYFQSNQLPDELTEVIGYFQARSFTGNRYNLILILGRNDMLPPNQEECSQFEKVTEHLEPVLNAILMRSGQDDKNLNIIDLLESLPLPICIKDRSESYLFTNDAFDNLKETLQKNYDKIEQPLTGKNTLCLYFDKALSEETDLYHFYRVTLLGELLNTLRHELSNPLFGLSLASDMLDASELSEQDEEIHQTISDIKSNSDRCQTIIKNFSSLYEDEDNFKDFDLISVINETLILTKSETKGIQKHISSSEESITLYSNPTWISQIIFNLVINSGQALKERFGDNLRDAAIHVVVESHHSNILIHINDNGPGVPELIQEKLFNPFFTTKDSGTGLGLSICKNLIQKLDGNISYRNCKTGGAQFSLSLPFVAL